MSESVKVSIPMVIPRGLRCSLLIEGKRFNCPLLQPIVYGELCDRFRCSGWDGCYRVDWMEKHERCLGLGA